MTSMRSTLIIVPRMFTKSEFIEALSYVPDDYDAKFEEFWSYVNDKLKVFGGRVQKVFRESLSKDTREALKVVSKDDEGGYALIVGFLEEGAELKPTEDPILVGETESWLNMIKDSPNDTLFELYEQSLKERNQDLSNRITQALGEGEVGLLIVDSRRRLDFPEDIRVIRVCPFDPADYLNTERVKARLKSKQASE
ncbi:MAG: hypothetical protein ABSB40_04105 [Nitrososphaeria archaeon]